MHWIAAALAAVIGFAIPLTAKEPKLKGADVVERHLASMGTPEARAAVKSRVAEGQAEVKLLMGGTGTGNGSAVFVSQGPKLHLTIRIGQSNYPGEEFAFDGQHPAVGVIAASQRSRLERFLYSYPEILSEGLIGGCLSTAWPLLDLEARRAKVDFDGSKKVNGKELYRLRYRPKSSQEMEIALYFDPETFHHVLTEYQIVPQIGTGLTPEQSSGLQQRYHQVLQEEFSDFRAVDGVTVPTHWTMRLTQESPRGTSLMVFETTFSTIKDSQPLDAKAFVIP